MSNVSKLKEKTQNAHIKMAAKKAAHILRKKKEKRVALALPINVQNTNESMLLSWHL